MLWFNSLKSDTKDAIKWLTDELKHLKELKEECEKLKNDTTASEQEKDYKKIKNTWDYIEKCEERSKRNIKSIIEDLKKEIQKNPSLATLEKQIEIDANNLLNSFSLYEANFKSKLETILSDIKIQKERFGDPAKQAENDIKKIANEIEQSIQTLIQWVEKLEASMKEILKQQEVKPLINDKFMQMRNLINKKDIGQLIKQNPNIPDELKFQILSCIEEFEKIARNNNQIDANNLFLQYQRLFTAPITYLLRHPDPFIGKDGSTYMGTSNRNITDQGLRDAKQFADSLAEFISICPLKVHINIYSSNSRRASLYADIVERVINTTHSFQNGNIRINKYHSKELSCDYYNKQIEDFSGKSLGELMQAKQFPDFFKQWIISDEGRNFENQLKEFISEKIALTTMKNEYLLITLMFTHLPNIATFLDINNPDAWKIKPGKNICYYNGKSHLNF